MFIVGRQLEGPVVMLSVHVYEWMDVYQLLVKQKKKKKKM